MWRQIEGGVYTVALLFIGVICLYILAAITAPYRDAPPDPVYIITPHGNVCGAPTLGH